MCSLPWGWKYIDWFHLSINYSHPHSVTALAPESGLLPKSLGDHALVNRWCHLVESELFDITVRTWLLCQGKFGSYSEEVAQYIRLTSHYTLWLRKMFTTKERRVLAKVNKHLEGRTYVIGNKVTQGSQTRWRSHFIIRSIRNNVRISPTS